MTSLNLDALKKKASDTPDNIIAHMDTPETTGLNASSGIPKISLMKLKESSFFGTENNASTPNQIQEVTDIVQETEIISSKAPTPVLIEDTEPMEQFSSESIFSATAQTENQSANVPPEVETKPMEAKEFFPSLNLMEDFSISDDLLGIEDMSIKAEIVAPVVVEEVAAQTNEITETPSMITEESQAVIETTPIEEVIQEMAVVTEEQEVVLSEDLKEEISGLSMSTTHVEEVKNELSEQRKGGFRFFAKKKITILTGIGIIGTFSLIGIFSSGIFSSTIPVGKSNIQEALQPTISEEEVTQPTSTGISIEEGELPTQESTPIAIESNQKITESSKIISSYEAGRDFTVIKNTKKNLKKQ